MDKVQLFTKDMKDSETVLGEKLQSLQAKQYEWLKIHFELVNMTITVVPETAIQTFDFMCSFLEHCLESIQNNCEIHLTNFAVDGTLSSSTARNQVFLATKDGEKYILKVYRFSTENDMSVEYSIQAMRRELQALDKLKHDNIVQPKLFFIEKNALQSTILFERIGCMNMESWLEEQYQNEEEHSRYDVAQKLHPILGDILRGVCLYVYDI